jgi:hypothetical protein
MTDTVKSTIRHIALAIITPLLEKNVIKTFALDLPVVFSMSRVILLAFAVAMLHQIWLAGVAGWPEATLSVAIVLGLPILGALERVNPADVLELSKIVIARFGEGAARTEGSVYGQEPSKFDDHRKD